MDAQERYNRYLQLKKKYKVVWVPDDKPESLAKGDIVYSSSVGYAHCLYTVYKKPDSLTDDEIALLLDGGNLCFGYVKSGTNEYKVYTD